MSTPRPVGIRNLVVVNALLAIWYAWRLGAALAAGAAGLAALQVGPILALVATGPLLLWRLPATHRVSIAAALLGIIWVATVAFAQLAMRGLWNISLDVVTGIVLTIYLVGVHGYLRHPKVRSYFAQRNSD